jgi:NADH-quinone oxidoreductase subunit G
MQKAVCSRHRKVEVKVQAISVLTPCAMRVHGHELMPKLKIDGIEIEVPKGMKVIEAAERLGIIIPRFCYHAALGSVGACRMCAVKFLEGPVKGVQMSCMTDAQDGMVVSTTDEEAVDFRKHVIEWLMMNHPHDCPVCDEGGHCLLQDMTVAGGHGIRRYLGEKRTYRDQYLGVFVQHEMNRCIHCWRCRRYYQEFTGYRDLGALQIACHTYFGRFTDGSLESPFSGNLIDICPTGVYTDKPSRFKGRRWDYQRGPSLCIHCSLGCHTIMSARYREIIRLEARFSESVNGFFICDRGRYGFYYEHLPERPRRARIGKEEVLWDKAIRTAGERLKQIMQNGGPRSIACMSSSRSGLENQGMLKRFCRLQGWQEPGYFDDPIIAHKVKRAISRLDKRLAISMREIEKADFILAVGADPVNEAPMLTMAMRQAYRNGATIAVIDPRPIFLPFEFVHLSVSPSDMDLLMSLVVKGAVSRSVAEALGPDALRFYDAVPTDSPFDPLINNHMVGLSSKLQQSHRPIIVCGTDIVRKTTPEVAADNALLLQAAKEKTGLFYLMPGPNAFGAALLSSGNYSLVQIIEAIENRSVKALILVESDPFSSFPDRQRLEQAFNKLDFLLVLDYLNSRSAQLAHILLPTMPLFETESTFINQEGRVQFSKPVHAGGIPIEQISAGDHPPRTFRSDIPGSEPKAAWQILEELAHAMSLVPKMPIHDLWGWLAKENPIFTNLKPSDPRENIRLIPDQRSGSPFSQDALGKLEKSPSPLDSLELLLVDWTFGTEELSGYSKYIQQVEKAPCLLMNPNDAMRAGLRDRDRLTLQLDGGPLEMEVSIVENMASGVMVLPRHRQLQWQKVKEYPVKVPIDRIKKV